MPRLQGGKMLAQLNRENPQLGALLSKLIDSHNHVASQAGIDPVGQASAPNPPNAVNVTVTGEMAHVRITDNSSAARSKAYFTETYGDAQYSQLLHVQPHGASRDATLQLPTFESAGPMKAYYMRSYSQTPGSPPSAPIAYPTYVTMSGATVGDVPPSSGSGTANTQGTQLAQGFGKVPTRAASQPKSTKGLT